MPDEIKSGKFVSYLNDVGIINRIYQVDDNSAAIEIHFLMPDGTTRMKLNEENKDRYFPETDIVVVMEENWNEIEVLSPFDERIPESRRAVRNT
jgi:hypothetical protein